MPPGKDLRSQSDQEVVVLARAGREAAYRELLRRYERPVFTLIYRAVADHAIDEREHGALVPAQQLAVRRLPAGSRQHHNLLVRLRAEVFPRGHPAGNL